MTTEIGCAHDPVGIKGEDAATIVTPTNPLPVVLASGSITLPPEVEIKNDVGNPVPTLDANSASIKATLDEILLRDVRNARDYPNELNTALGPGAVGTGTQFTRIDSYGSVEIAYLVQVPLTSVVIEWSNDGINPLLAIDGTTSIPVKVIQGFYIAYSIINTRQTAPYYRLKVTNGATDQSASPFIYSRNWLNKEPYNGTFQYLDDQLTNISKALLVRAVQAGTRLDGTFANAALPEHDRDLQNEQPSPLINGANVQFTVDEPNNTIESVGHGIIADKCVHFSTPTRVSVVATVDDTTDTIESVGHGLVLDEPIRFSTTGTMPTNLASATTYYVINPTTDDFQVSLTVGGVAVDIASLGSGTFTYIHYDVLPSPLVAGSHYFVVNPTTDDFQVATTRGGAAINLTTDKTGTVNYSVAAEFTGTYTRVSDFEHFEILYASLGTMAVVEKIWSGDGVNALDRTITNGSTTLGSDIIGGTSSFNRYDRGAIISGAGIPAGATITEFITTSSVRISAPATATATGVSVSLANLLSPSAIPVQVLTGYNVYYDVNEGRNTAPFYKFHVINGPTNQSNFPGFIDLKWMFHTAYHGNFGLLTATLNNLSRALLTRSVQAGIRLDGTFDNIQFPEHGTDTSNLFQTAPTNGTLSAFTVDEPNNKILADGHQLANGDAVWFTSDDVLPAPLTSTTTSGTPPVTNDTIYWVTNKSDNDFQILTTPNGTTPVNLTTVGSGTLQFQKRGQLIGTFRDASQIGSILTLVASLGSPPAVVRFEWSDNGTTITSGLLSTTAIATTVTSGFNIALVVTNTMVGRYYRVRYVNGATVIPATFLIQPFIGKHSFNGSYAGLTSTLSFLSTALLTRSVQAGTTPDGGFDNLRIQGIHTLGSTSTALPGDTGGSDHIFRGEWFEWQDSYNKMVLVAKADVSGTIHVDFSQHDTPVNGDDTSIDDTITFGYDPAITPLFRKHFVVQSRWVRVRYENGPAAHATDAFQLDVAYLTDDPGLGMKAAIDPITENGLVGMVDAIDTSERGEVDGEFVHVKTTRSTVTNKDGKNVHITGIDPDIKIGALRAFENGHLLVGATRVPIPPPSLLNVKGIKISNLDADTDVFWGGALITSTSLSDVIFARGGIDLELDGSEQLYLVAGDTGAATSTSDRYGSSVANNVSVTNPNNILGEAGNAATFDATGDNLDILGYTAAGAYPDIASVVLRIKGKKDVNETFETVAHNETQIGSTAGAGTIVTASLAGGSEQLYLVSITRNAANTITSVSGAGLTFAATNVVNISNGGRRLDIWYAYGNATSGAITVTMSSSTNAIVSASRFSNVDPSTPIQVSASATGTSATPAASAAGTNKGMSYMALSHEETGGTAGAGYTERSDNTNGTGSNIVTLGTQTKPLVTTATENGTYTVPTSEEWIAGIVTLLPRAAQDPVITVTYDVDGDAGATSLASTFSSTSYTEYSVDITGDRAWVAGDIPLFTANVAATMIGAAFGLIDSVWLEVTEIEADAQARVTYAWLAEIQ